MLIFGGFDCGKYDQLVDFAEMTLLFFFERSPLCETFHAAAVDRILDHRNIEGSFRITKKFVIGRRLVQHQGSVHAPHLLHPACDLFISRSTSCCSSLSSLRL
jgi:hypothetical protein